MTTVYQVVAISFMTILLTIIITGIGYAGFKIGKLNEDVRKIKEQTKQTPCSKTQSEIIGG